MIFGATLLSTQNVYGATPTPEISPTISSSEKNESLVDQINELKDKVASRVAQLKLVEKRGAVGVVDAATDTRITMTNGDGDILIVDVDEITKFSSPSAKGTFGISDLQKGSTVSVIGLYNKESKHILARFVTAFTLPTFLSGTVKDVSKEDFTITVTGPENVDTIVDIETTTKINTYEDGEVVRSGFTKIAAGDRVEIVGYADKKEKNRITGSYILQLNDLTPPTPTSSETSDE